MMSSFMVPHEDPQGERANSRISGPRRETSEWLSPTTEFGLDFVVAVVETSTISDGLLEADVVTCRDLVSASYAAGTVAANYYGWFGEFVDPDPFGTSDGRWWVHAAGKGDEDDPSAFSLQRFKNFPTALLALTSACRPWDEAWGSSPFAPHL